MNEKPFISRRFHYIVDAFDVDPVMLSDKDFLIKTVKEIATLLDMKILKGPDYAVGIPENPGITLYTIIDFSHIAIHTFTDPKEFCLDIFSCKEFDVNKLDKYVRKTFNLRDNKLYKANVRYDQLNTERDRRHFPVDDYLQEYYSNLSKENKQILDWYHKVYKNIQGKKKLFEFGGAPTIFQFISAVDNVDEIVVGSHLREIKDEFSHWINNKDEYWNDYVEYVLNKENSQAATTKQIEEKLSQIKAKIGSLININLFEIDNNLVDKFDIVQSDFSPECATDDISEYKRMIKYIYSYLKKDGVLLMTALSGAIAYKVKDKYYPTIYLDGKLIREYLEDAGFEINEISKIRAEDADDSKYNGILLIQATKK